MSSSIVLALRVFGVPGAAEVLVMAVALGLFLALALSRPVASRRAIVQAAGDEPPAEARRPRALESLSGWLRPNRRHEDRPAVEADVAEPQATNSGESAGVPVIGYATLSGRSSEESDEELAKQADVIARACERRGLTLVEVVREPYSALGHDHTGLFDARPGLRYALGRIAAGDAQGMVVPGLRRLTRSIAELGPMVDWFTRREVRLIAVAQGLDTGERDGRVAARLLIEVSRWERERVGDPIHVRSFAHSLDDHLDEDLVEDIGEVATEERSS
jgi:Resolvase, N terminal domain